MTDEPEIIEQPGGEETALALPTLPKAGKRKHGGVGPGNKIAVKHGAESPAMVAELSAAIVAELTEMLPLTRPIDRYGIQATADSIAIRNMIAAWMLGKDKTGKVRGPLNGRGTPRAALKLYLAVSRDVRDWLAQGGATAMARSLMAPGLADLARARQSQEAQKRLRERQAKPKRGKS